MKLFKMLKYTVLAGLATLTLPMSAQAALPFGEWTVTTDATNTGLIAGCPTGGTCTPLVYGEGFLQQQVGIGPDTYIQTIITDPTANCSTPPCDQSLPYSDESYVRSTGTSSGIAAKQSMSDANLNFGGSTTLYVGWAATTDGSIKPLNSANLNITQNFTDPGVLGVFGDEFNSSFGLKINMDANGNQTGKSMSIGQTVEMGNGVNVNTGDIQRFIIEQRSGDMLTAATTGFVLGTTSFDTSTIPATPLNGTAGTGATNTTGGAQWVADDPATTTVVEGDDVMLVWLGQTVGDGSTGGLSKFGYESVKVVGNTASGTANQFASTFSTDTTGIGAQTGLSSAQPFNWDAATFGYAAPTLPQPAISTTVNNVTTVTDAGACENGVAADGVTCL